MNAQFLESLDRLRTQWELVGKRFNKEFGPATAYVEVVDDDNEPLQLCYMRLGKDMEICFRYRVDDEWHEWRSIANNSSVNMRVSAVKHLPHLYAACQSRFTEMQKEIDQANNELNAIANERIL